MEHLLTQTSSSCRLRFVSSPVCFYGSFLLRINTQGDYLNELQQPFYRPTSRKKAFAFTAHIAVMFAPLREKKIIVRFSRLKSDLKLGRLFIVLVLLTLIEKR